MSNVSYLQSALSSRRRRTTIGIQINRSKLHAMRTIAYANVNVILHVFSDARQVNLNRDFGLLQNLTAPYTRLLQDDW